MPRVWYVDDDEADREELAHALAPHGISVSAYGRGEALIEAIEADGADVCEAVLVDWYLFEPNLPYRKEQPMQGGAIFERVRELKPYLPQFVVTVEYDPDMIGNTIMLRHPFRGYFAKRWLEAGNEAKVADFVTKIQAAVQEMKEVLASLPQHNVWKKYQLVYFHLRFDDPTEWGRFEREIEAEVDRLSIANFDRDNTLRKMLPIRKVNTKEQVKNVLIARRMIFSQLFFCQGQWHEVETFLGYEEKPDKTYPDLYAIYDSGFRNYCNTLGFEPKKLAETGEGLLVEETRWLQRYCRENNLTYGFPIVA